MKAAPPKKERERQKWRERTFLSMLDHVSGLGSGGAQRITGHTAGRMEGGREIVCEREGGALDR